MNERKLYEWTKATPENLPKEDGNYFVMVAHINAIITDRLCETTMKYTVKDGWDKNSWSESFIVREYLREVDLKWPSEYDKQVKITEEWIAEYKNMRDDRDHWRDRYLDATGA